ncbi:MAG: chain length determinant protein tyrosine kinase EpsG [Betaproteobacteria bacterium]|nr:MAG: chain length determinant protein tyrosine kinase EpsG [Betaproteobacteria bacterium]
MPSQSIALKAAERRLGAVLIHAGRLRPQDVEHILQLQRQKGLRFGDAGKEVGLLTQADIEFALARQFDHPYLRRGESKVSEEVVAAYDPFSPQVEALRAVRGQLMLRWLDSEPASKALAILSAARKEGRSFIAANLAVVFAQLGARTLLIDADLRQPCLHRLFGLDNRAGLSAVLSGPFAQLLQQLAAHVDLILLDCPPVAQNADAQTIAVRAGAALIVVRKHSSCLWRVQGISDSVVQAKCTIVGAVLNDF